MLILYDVNHNKIEGLTNCKGIKIDKEINVEDTLSFSFPMADPKYLPIKEECYVRTEDNEYVIKELSYADTTMVDYICKVNLEDLKGKVIEWFETVEATCLASVNMVLVGTGWSVETCNVIKLRSPAKANSSIYAILKEIQSLYGCEMTFNAITKKIYIYQAMGLDRGAYFAEQLNLKNVNVQSNSYDYITRLIPIGADGLDITLVNGGLNYIQNLQYSSKIITAYWEDNRYTVEQDLLDDAIARLAYLSWPYRAYSADVVDLAKFKPEYSILDYSLGDTITLMANSQSVREKQRIIKMTVYPDAPEQNTCEIANKILSLEQLQVRFEETSNVVDNVTTSGGYLDGTKVDGIDWTKLQNVNILMADIQDLDVMIARIGSLETTRATITQLTAANAAIIALQADKASITQLNAVQAAIDVLAAASATILQLDAALARIGTLETTRATITQLNVTNAAIDTLEANMVSIALLDAAKARITSLEADTAVIEDLLAGNIDADNIKAGTIVVGSTIIADGAIASAQIANLDVAKLLAGAISTDKFDIQSDNGRLTMIGDVLKVIDAANKERVSLGLNGTDYNLLIRGADGTTVLFGIDGVTHAGITDGAVDDSKVAAGAEINGSKLEKESLVTAINGATTLLKSSHVTYDPTGQTFEIAFGDMLVTIDAQGTDIANQLTSIGVLQGEILLKATKVELENLAIGGRNLFQKSATLNDYTTGTDVVGNPLPVYTVDAINGDYQTFINTNGGNRYWNPLIIADRIKDQIYTISLEIKTDAIWGVYWYPSENYSSLVFPNTLGVWKKWSFTYTQTGITKHTPPLFGFTNAIAGKSISFRKLKLELGNKATDWTAAPEDITTLITTAQTQANLGVTNAATANALLADLASDSKLTAVEKQQVKTEWDSIVSEKVLNDAQADLFAIVTEKTAYGTAYSALSTYITPLLSSLTVTSDIVGTTFRSTFKTYYDALTTLLNAIAAKAKSVADAGASDAATALANTGTLGTAAGLLTSRVLSAESKITPAAITSIVEQTSTTLANKTYVNQTASGLALAAAATIRSEYGAIISNLASYFNFIPTGMLVSMLGSKFATLYAADKIQFLQDGNVIQWISAFKNYMTDLVITGSFSLGNYLGNPTHKFESLSNKHVVVRYVGG